MNLKLGRELPVWTVELSLDLEAVIGPLKGTLAPLSEAYRCDELPEPEVRFTVSSALRPYSYRVLCGSELGFQAEMRPPRWIASGPDAGLRKLEGETTMSAFHLALGWAGIRQPEGLFGFSGIRLPSVPGKWIEEAMVEEARNLGCRVRDPLWDVVIGMLSVYRHLRGNLLHAWADSKRDCQSNPFAGFPPHRWRSLAAGSRTGDQRDPGLVTVVRGGEELKATDMETHRQRAFLDHLQRMGLSLTVLRLSKASEKALAELADIDEEFWTGWPFQDHLRESLGPLMLAHPPSRGPLALGVPAALRSRFRACAFSDCAHLVVSLEDLAGWDVVEGGEVDLRVWKLTDKRTGSGSFQGEQPMLCTEPVHLEIGRALPDSTPEALWLLVHRYWARERGVVLTEGIHRRCLRLPYDALTLSIGCCEVGRVRSPDWDTLPARLESALLANLDSLVSLAAVHHLLESARGRWPGLVEAVQARHSLDTIRDIYLRLLVTGASVRDHRRILEVLGCSQDRPEALLERLLNQPTLISGPARGGPLALPDPWQVEVGTQLEKRLSAGLGRASFSGCIAAHGRDGLAEPEFESRACPGLGPFEYRVSAGSTVLGTGEIRPGMLLASGPDQALQGLEGVFTLSSLPDVWGPVLSTARAFKLDPPLGCCVPELWIDPSQAFKAQAIGCQLRDPLAEFGAHLENLYRLNRRCLFEQHLGKSALAVVSPDLARRVSSWHSTRQLGRCLADLAEVGTPLSPLDDILTMVSEVSDTRFGFVELIRSRFIADARSDFVFIALDSEDEHLLLHQAREKIPRAKITQESLEMALVAWVADRNPGQAPLIFVVPSLLFPWIDHLCSTAWLGLVKAVDARQIPKDVSPQALAPIEVPTWRWGRPEPGPIPLVTEPLTIEIGSGLAKYEDDLGSLVVGFRQYLASLGLSLSLDRVRRTVHLPHRDLAWLVSQRECGRVTARGEALGYCSPETVAAMVERFGEESNFNTAGDGIAACWLPNEAIEGLPHGVVPMVFQQGILMLSFDFYRVGLPDLVTPAVIDRFLDRVSVVWPDLVRAVRQRHGLEPVREVVLHLLRRDISVLEYRKILAVLAKFQESSEVLIERVRRALREAIISAHVDEHDQVPVVTLALDTELMLRKALVLKRSPCADRVADRFRERSTGLAREFFLEKAVLWVSPDLRRPLEKLCRWPVLSKREVPRARVRVLAELDLRAFGSSGG